MPQRSSKPGIKWAFKWIQVSSRTSHADFKWFQSSQVMNLQLVDWYTTPFLVGSNTHPGLPNIRGFFSLIPFTLRCAHLRIGDEELRVEILKNPIFPWLPWKVQWYEELKIPVATWGAKQSHCKRHRVPWDSDVHTAGRIDQGVLPQSTPYIRGIVAWIFTGSWDDPFSLSSIVDSSESTEDPHQKYIRTYNYLKNMFSFQIYLSSCVHMLQHALLITLVNMKVPMSFENPTLSNQNSPQTRQHVMLVKLVLTQHQLGPWWIIIFHETSQIPEENQACLEGFPKHPKLLQLLGCSCLMSLSKSLPSGGLPVLKKHVHVIILPKIYQKKTPLQKNH